MRSGDWKDQYCYIKMVRLDREGRGGYMRTGKVRGMFSNSYNGRKTETLPQETTSAIHPSVVLPPCAKIPG